MKKCSNCNSNIQEGDLFCVKCGQRVDTMSTTVGKRKKSLVTISGVAVLIILISVAGIFFGDNILHSFKSSNIPEGKAVDSVDVFRGQSAAVGNLEEYNFMAKIPEGALPEGTVNLSICEEDYGESVDSERFSLLMEPIDISFEGYEYIRTDEPITLSFKLDQSLLNDIEDESFIQLGYYFEGEWYLQPVNTVDFDTGIVTADIYHFSPYTITKAEKEEIIRQKAKEMAIEEWEEENNRKAFKEATQTPMEKMITEVTGIKDTSVMKTILDGMANDNNYIYFMTNIDKMNLGGKDAEDGKIALANKIGEIVIDKLTGMESGDDLSAFIGLSESLGASIEEDPKMAAEKIADAVLSTNTFYQAIKTSAAITKASVEAWHKNGIEEMYQAYKNGADSGWFGYNVKAHDFDGVLDQSGGIGNWLYVKAKYEYCQAKGVDEDELSAEELKEIQVKAEENLRKQFEDRLAQEHEIDDNAQYYEKIIKELEKNKIDQKAAYIDTFDGLTYEQRLNRYMIVADEILKLTGKKVTFAAAEQEGQMSANSLAIAVRYWYNSREKAMEYLTENGYYVDNTEPEKTEKTEKTGKTEKTEKTVDPVDEAAHNQWQKEMDELEANLKDLQGQLSSLTANMPEELLGAGMDGMVEIGYDMYWYRAIWAKDLPGIIARGELENIKDYLGEGVDIEACQAFFQEHENIYDEINTLKTKISECEKSIEKHRADEP